MKKIDGHPGWVKDAQGVLHNTNQSEIQQAKERKQRRLAEQQRINNLESDVKEVKDMMRLMMEKLNEL
jgi:Tfp pilus assembly protein PilN